MPKAPAKATMVPCVRVGGCAGQVPPRVGSYLAAILGADSPGAPIPANKSASDFVERTLSLFLRVRPALECRRCRRFQVLRLFDAMGGLT